MPVEKPLFQTARKTVSTFRSADSRIKKLAHRRVNFDRRIKKSAKRKTAKDIEKVLKEMPIEQINADKLGIKVSALRAYGITNVYQLIHMPEKRIKEIRGIGEKSFESIIRVRKQIAQSVNENTALRISSDDRTPEADAFVKSVFQSLGYRALQDKAAKTYDANHEKIAQLVRTARPATSRLRWQLSSQQKREAALQSVRQLEEMQQEPFLDEYDALQKEELRLLKAKHDEYWKDFSFNAASYYAFYENIKRNKADGNGKTLKRPEAVAIANGLPRDFAIAVGQVALNLEGLKFPLRAYQEYGVQYIIKQGAVLLGDDMGLGKTAQAIASMVCLRNAGATHFMVVCPASVLTNWVREIQKFSDLTPIKIHGEFAESYDAWIQKGGVCVTTYEMLQKLPITDDFKLSMLVVDEAHYVKNPKAQRTQALLRFREKTDRALFMTGTAIENNVSEMCFLISCLNPAIADSIKGSTNIVMAPAFREKIAYVYFRRKKEDVLDELPEKTEQEIHCTLNEYEAVKYKESVCKGDFMGMRQVSWNVEDVAHSSKGEQLKNICEQAIANGEKVIVFSFFRNTIGQVCKLIDEGICFGPISGDVSPDKRQKIVDDFSQKEGGAVLVLQIGAGGTGMNMQAANVVVLCEPQLKPSIENQAIARAYRMGQSRKVFVYRLLSENTIDERISVILKNKQKLFDEFADKSVSGDESLAGVDTEELKSILASEQERLAV